MYIVEKNPKNNKLEYSWFRVHLLLEEASWLQQSYCAISPKPISPTFLCTLPVWSPWMAQQKNSTHSFNLQLTKRIKSTFPVSLWRWSLLLPYHAESAAYWMSVLTYLTQLPADISVFSRFWTASDEQKQQIRHRVILWSRLKTKGISVDLIAVP